MSYDLTIKSDGSGHRSADLDSLDRSIRRIPGISSADGGYRYRGEAADVYFEIDAFLADAEGDLTQSDSREVNRVTVHIPAAFFDTSQKQALEVSRVIARVLGWRVFDEQTGQFVATGAESLAAEPISDGPTQRRQVFRFWCRLAWHALRGKSGFQPFVACALLCLSASALVYAFIQYVVVPLFNALGAR